MKRVKNIVFSYLVNQTGFIFFKTPLGLVYLSENSQISQAVAKEQLRLEDKLLCQTAPTAF